MYRTPQTKKVCVSSSFRQPKDTSSEYKMKKSRVKAGRDLVVAIVPTDRVTILSTSSKSMSVEPLDELRMQRRLVQYFHPTPSDQGPSVLSLFGFQPMVGPFTFGESERIPMTAKVRPRVSPGLSFFYQSM